MALAGSVTGDGILVERRKSTRLFSVAFLGLLRDYKEETVEETREWVALTRSAAQTYVDAAAAHPTPTTGTYSYSMAEDKRYVGGTGSYIVKRVETVKAVTDVTPEE